jgi:AraC-like DNA-binding protein
MASDKQVIASGNLATGRRPITGVLGQLGLLEIDDAEALDIFRDVGLPARALAEPDFPISLQQELEICSALVQRMGADSSPTTLFFRARHQMGIENLGVLGMAMRHADTALHALKVCLDFPQLTWGHSRMIVSRTPGRTWFSFAMERPELRDASEAHIDRVVEYGVVLDLVSSLRNIEDIVDAVEVPLRICLPFPQPVDWALAEADLPCPVEFDAEEASLTYSDVLEGEALPRANPLVHRSFVSIAEKFAQMLTEEISLAERVTRWLWAYTPPLRRGEIAAQLAMSERSLTRQLRAEGTSYAELLALVQEERARNFLRNPGLSVSEIAYRLGYSEPAAFSRAFTHWTGQSPLKWRQSLFAGTG